MSAAAVRDVTPLLADLRVGEAPRWHDGRLFVSDLQAGEVVAVDLDGNRETNIGICLDAEDCIWVAAPEPEEARGFWRVAEGREIKDSRPSDRHAVAVMLGGPDGDHLFMLEASAIEVTREAERSAPGEGRVLVGRVDVPGAGLP